MSKIVYIVTKNADFTEGRGPMLFHKVFDDEATAVAYIMDQDGIYGSKQHESTSEYNRDGRRSFNGYNLEAVPLITKHDMQNFAVLQEELEELENEINEATNRAEVIRKMIS